MSFDRMEGQRRGMADAILAKFGAVIDQAEQNAAAKTTDPGMKKLMAARMALEYAVLATAREKHMAMDLVATALQGATAAQQAAMIKEGSAALGRAYRVEPEVLVNVFAGHLTEFDMPTGLASTPDIDKMVDASRTLMSRIVQDEYANRGRFEGAARRDDSFLALRSDGIVAPAKTELAVRLAFMESSIDAAVGKGAISQVHAEGLKERIEAQVFQPRPPQSLQFSPAFTAFWEKRGKGLRIEAMREVRGVAQSQTVQEIVAKLALLRSSFRRPDRPPDHRMHQPRER